NPADSACCAEPKGIAVIQHIENVVAEQAVSDGESQKPAIPESVQTSTERPYPESPIRVLIQGANLVAAQAVGGRKEPVAGGRNVPQAASNRACPQGTIGSLCEPREGTLEHHRTGGRNEGPEIGAAQLSQAVG